MIMFATITDTIFLVLGILVGVIALSLFVYKFFIQGAYNNSKRKIIDSPLTAEELARANLDRAGLDFVKVKIRRLTTGYNQRKKTLYITKKMNKKPSVYSISKVMQLVSLAIILNTDEEARKKYRGATIMNYSATAIFFIMIIVSAVVEASTDGTPAVISLIILGLALAFYIWSIVVSVKKGSLLTRANKDAMLYIDNMGIFDEDDIAKINKLYDLSAKEFTVDKILAIVYTIYYALKFIGKLIALIGKRG